MLFCKANNIRGDLPIGVKYHRDNLTVSCSINENDKTINKHLGSFKPDQVEEAFQCYKEFKEAYIKQIADEYAGMIPDELYFAMYNWEVEIDD